MPTTKIRPGYATIPRKQPKEQPSNSDRYKGLHNQLNVSDGELQEYTAFTAGKTKINKQIEKILPELKQAKLIITSSIVSANDYTKKELISDYNDVVGLPPSALTDVKNIITDTVTRYKIVQNLTKIVDTALFEEGAHIEVIIPRHKIQEVITGIKLDTISDLEAFNITKTGIKGLESKGLIKINNTTNVSVNIKGVDTAFNINDFNLSYTSDHSLLALPELLDLKRNALVSRECYLDESSKKDLESIDVNILNAYNSSKRPNTEHIIHINTKKDRPDYVSDVPFRLTVSSDMVIPLYTDDPSKQVGFFLLVDENGRTLRANDFDGDYSEYMNSTVTKSLLNKANINLTKANEIAPTLDRLKEITAHVLYETLTTATKNSVYRANFNIEEENSFIKVLLYRALTEKKSRIIFLPAEYVSYIAFDYRENGSGKTLIEDISVLASFKAMLTLAEIYSSINKAIPTTEAVIDIDENDPEPMKTKEVLKQLILDSRSGSIPWGETSLEKQGKWIQNAGIRFTWNHPSFPNTKITYDKGNNKNEYEVDSETKENINKDILKAMGLSPSIIDDANGADFASVAILNNSLANKINSERQSILEDGLSDRVKKIMRCDGQVLNDISKLIDSNSKQIISSINSMIEKEENKIKIIDAGLRQYIVNDIIDGVRVLVPRAESKDNDGLREQFSNYVTSITEFLDILKTTMLIDETAGPNNVDVEAVLGTIKLEMVINWCEEHNYARNIVKFLNDNNDSSLDKRIKDLAATNSNVIKLILDVAKKKKKLVEDETPTEEAEPLDETQPTEDATPTTEEETVADGTEEMGDENNLGDTEETEPVKDEADDGKNEEAAPADETKDNDTTNKDGGEDRY